MARFRAPSFPVIMLLVMGVFEIVAAFATFIPSFIHDRVPT